MAKQNVKIGYEIGSGKEVNLPLAHTVITGLTQEAGKTTCIMGLVKRSGLRALIIKTKIGEKAISEGTLVPPFYKESFDWEYASELLESSRKEKLKFERSWIIKYSRNATSLLEFKRNIDTAMAEGKLRELDKSVLLTLQAYLEKILPELQYMPLSNTLDIREGINIMDLERFKEETQAIIIRSVLHEILEKEKGVICVLPECWKYLPEQMGSPVKRPAEALVRQGAANRNYLWLDSQDITGISKVILKQVSNWVLGYQREINEIKRTLDQLPLSKTNKPKPEDVATLGLGHFFVATSDFTKKVYAQPVWLSDEDAEKVARGIIDIKDLEQPLQHIAPHQILPTRKDVPPALSGGNGAALTLDFNRKINELREDFVANKNDTFTKFEQLNQTLAKIYEEIFSVKNANAALNEDEIVMRVLQKVPAPSASSSLDRAAIVAEVLAKLPRMSGGVTYTVSPIEKLKRDFQEEAKAKILSEVAALNDDQKKMLKWIEQRGQGITKNAMFLACFGQSATSGPAYSKRVPFVTEMKMKGLVRVDTAQRIFPNLKDRVSELITQYGATPEEIEQTYNALIGGLI